MDMNNKLKEDALKQLKKLQQAMKVISSPISTNEGKPVLMVWGGVGISKLLETF